MRQPDPHPTTYLTTFRKSSNMVRNYCKNKTCRYCPNLDRKGMVTCTGTSYIPVKRISLQKHTFDLHNHLPHLPTTICGTEKNKHYLNASRGTMATSLKPYKIPSKLLRILATHIFINSMGDMIGQNFAQATHKST